MQNTVWTDATSYLPTEKAVMNMIEEQVKSDNEDEFSIKIWSLKIMEVGEQTLEEV